MKANPTDPTGAKATEEANRSIEKLLNERVPQQSGANPGVFHCDTFTLYKPWSKCPKCKDAILGAVEGRDDAGEIQRGEPTMELPDDEDYLCPHTNKAKFEAVRQRIAVERLFHIESLPSTLADGSVQITVQWWERPQGSENKEGKKRLAF